jgi:hypothetical protein
MLHNTSATEPKPRLARVAENAEISALLAHNRTETGNLLSMRAVSAVDKVLSAFASRNCVAASPRALRRHNPGMFTLLGSLGIDISKY